MDRNKIMRKKIEDPVSRQQFYLKCKDIIVKKSDELGFLCNSNIALLMVSQNGEVTSYSRGESFEDIMVKAMNQPVQLNRRSIPNPDEEHLMQSLVQSKSERGMIEKIAMYDTLLFSSSFILIYFFVVVLFYMIEKFLLFLLGVFTMLMIGQRASVLSSYEPQVENINTTEEADAYKEYILGAIERVQRSKVSISKS
uniref:MADS-box domain-containing protein n=1 Tax=Solanum lycopersicum TaxID=4081 RepID=A0A3Q7GTX2_SOLLC